MSNPGTPSSSLAWSEATLPQKPSWSSAFPGRNVAPSSCERLKKKLHTKWEEIILGKLIDIKHGYAFKGEYITTEETQNVLVTPGNFHIGGGFKDSKLKFYNGECPVEYILNENDIVITMTDLSKEGDTLGYGAKIPRSNNGKIYLHNQRIGRVILLDSSRVGKGFIYWLLRTPEYQGFVLGAATGTSVRHTSPNSIKQYKFLLPPLSEQQVIADILSSLDNKIDLLHRQNKTLESLAETLFRQWFVEEAQPDWAKGSLLELIELVGGGTPKTSIIEYWNGDIFWLSGGDIANNHKSFVLKSEKNITQAGLDNSSAQLLPKYATVISARGTVGKHCLLAEEMTFSQSNYGILPRIEGCYFFTYLLTNHIVEELQSAAYGSVFDTITTATFQDAKLSIPPKSMILKFEKEVKVYFNKQLENQLQIRTLENFRDILLPKLMSGEVGVKI